MPLNCGDLQQLVQGFSLIHGCDVVGGDKLRLATPFKYPDGSNIDVFLWSARDLFNGYVLSDLGQTASYLFDLQIKAQTTKRRKQIIADICDALNVQNENGELRILLPEENREQIPSAIVRLAQACIRVAD